MANQLQILGAVFAASLGLAFGSFLNVVVSRLPEGESIISPGSHCRHCDHALTWWQNVPVLSWLLLRGRCRQCKTAISPRYPLVELAVAILWLADWLKFSNPLFSTGPYDIETPHLFSHAIAQSVGYALLSWLLVALAALDAEHFWLPDWITIPGILIGFFYTVTINRLTWFFDNPVSLPDAVERCLIAIAIPAALILIIRLAYWLIRRKEGMGLGDAKLTAMLGAWLGLAGALESFVLAILAASLAALIWLVALAIRRKTDGITTKGWAQMPLPFGTFLCLGALTQLFFPSWLWSWWSQTYLPH